MKRALQEIAFLAEGPFPVALTRLAHMHGITTITEANLKETDAFMIPDGDAYTVVVNKNHLPVRKRFSIAHEIGHILLAQSQEVQFRKPVCSGSPRDPIEAACNQLAAAILMPAEPFSKIAASYDWSIRGVNALSQVFDTSVESTIRRCIGLATVPLAFVPWKVTPSKKPRHQYTLTTPLSRLRVLGLDRQHYLADVPSLMQAYSQEGIWEGIVSFEVSSSRKALPVTRSFVTESMGIGRGDTRRVFSLVHLSEQLPREELLHDSGTRTQPYAPPHALPGLL